MSPAERQARRRKRLKREEARAQREAERAAIRAKSEARVAASMFEARATIPHQPDPPLPDPADELVDQLAEAIELSPEITMADIQAAIARRLKG